jgi:rRNA small subunit pseudouridine methyltransferase Nep1
MSEVITLSQSGLSLLNQSLIFLYCTMKRSLDQMNESELLPAAHAEAEDNVGAEGVIIILDLATLETVKTKKGEFQLLNCDDHIALMRKHNKDPQDYRPDILHQELMAVLDSPLNKAGKLAKLYVHTQKNVLIEVSVKTRIPRTFKRFSGLMVQLLHKLKIRSADGGEMLLKVIKNPMSRHLPAGCRCYGTCFRSAFQKITIVIYTLHDGVVLRTGFSQHGTLYNPTHFAAGMPKSEEPIVLVFGAMAAGAIDPTEHPYVSSVMRNVIYFIHIHGPYDMNCFADESFPSVQ